MNATNAPQNAGSLQAEQKAHEPSMEDILASIRRIIADDDALPLSRRATPAEPEHARPEPANREPLAEAQAPAAPNPPTFAPPSPALSTQPVPSQAPASQTPPSQTPPSLLARSEAPLRPPPIPRLRDLALRLDDVPANLTPLVLKAPVWTEPVLTPPVLPEPAPAPLDLRPSLGDAPEAASEAPPAEDKAEEPAAPALHVVAPARQAPAPQPVPVKASISFERAGFKIPPLSFRASAPPPPVAPPSVSLASVEETQAPEPVIPPDATEKFFHDVSPVEPVASPPASDAPHPSVLPPARLDRVEPAMLSENNGFKVGAAFEALAESALLRDPDLVERLTREILRPLIKTWLDDNLPNVVERLVRAEIERVARGPKS
jgi:hypothetical protein